MSITTFRTCLLRRSLFVVLVLLSFTADAAKSLQPNIVLIFMDNFGYGELGVYGGGITRGGATPRINALAGEGMRLTNFNVEAQCTPSRAAIMTGRYAIRTGNASVPWLKGEYGLTQWEITMAEMLSDAGYVTGMFGKWHLGHTKGRFPTDQGFDEWYGIPNSSDESMWPAQQQFQEVMKEEINKFVIPEYIFRGKKGSNPERVKIYDAGMRKEIDRELTDHAKDFMTRQAKAGKPFFAFLPYTQTHLPVLPSKEFEGRSGNGKWGDVLMQIDAYTGELLDTVDQLGIADNTIFIFTSDNGPEMAAGHHGWGGPWTGTYFTAKEGSLRVPYIMRWPGKVPAGTVSNEIVHEMDLFTTLAGFAGGKIPSDRVIDSADQGDFFLGKTDKSARDSIVVYVGEEIFGVKWRNWKMLTKEFVGGNGLNSVVENRVPAFYNLYTDPKEEHPWTSEAPGNFWVRWPMADIMLEHVQSLQEEPPIPSGAADPWRPKR
jgi:arylsulfatase